MHCWLHWLVVLAALLAALMNVLAVLAVLLATLLTVLLAVLLALVVGYVGYVVDCVSSVNVCDDWVGCVISCVVGYVVGYVINCALSYCYVWNLIVSSVVCWVSYELCSSIMYYVCCCDTSLLVIYIYIYIMASFCTTVSLGRCELCCYSLCAGTLFSSLFPENINSHVWNTKSEPKRDLSSQAWKCRQYITYNEEA